MDNETTINVLNSKLSVRHISIIISNIIFKDKDYLIIYVNTYFNDVYTSEPYLYTAFKKI